MLSSATLFSIALLSGLTMGDSVGTLSFVDPGGKTVQLDAPGVLYFVNFWMPGCKYCLVEAPDFEQLAKEYEHDKRVRFVTVLWTGTDAAGRISPKDAKRAGTNFPVYSDPKRWWDLLGVTGVPAKFLIRDGKILRDSRGADARPYEHWKWLIGRELDDDSETETKAP